MVGRAGRCSAVAPRSSVRTDWESSMMRQLRLLRRALAHRLKVFLSRSFGLLQ